MKNRNLLAICALIVCMPNISSQKIVEQIDIFSDSIALSEYFYINTHYSLMNYINKAEGFVTCQFDTDSVGRIDNLQIINSNGNETLLEIEAKRLIYSIPIQKRDINTTHKVTVNFKWEDNQIFQMGAIEEQPEFPGGNTEMMKFISQNLRWPTEAAEMSIQGKVICGFVVEKDGSINIIEIARSVYHLLDAEALRVIGRMPKWKAGKHNGKPVRVYFLLPISFRMQDNP